MMRKERETKRAIGKGCSEEAEGIMSSRFEGVIAIENSRVRCLICARQKRAFYTANTGDMTLHINAIHLKEESTA